MKTTGMAAGAKTGGARVALPDPKVSVVTMAAVPQPPATRGRDKYGSIYERIRSLAAGSAVRVDFETEKQAQYVRAQLRKRAKTEKKYLSHSRTPDNRSMWFWIERDVETASGAVGRRIG